LVRKIRREDVTFSNNHHKQIAQWLSLASPKKNIPHTVEAVQNWIFSTGCIKKATRYGWLTSMFWVVN